GGQLATVFKCYFNGLGRGGWVAVCIVSIGREAKTDRAFVHFLGCGVKLRQASEIPNDQWQYAGGERVERPEMADGTLSQNAAHAINHVVRGQASGFIDNQDAIHGEIW